MYNLIDNITYKGLEYIEYLVENQSDELINKDHLLKKYIDMYFDIERKIRLENQYENVEKDDAINFSNIEKNEG